jgi:hypothetical protein
MEADSPLKVRYTTGYDGLRRLHLVVFVQAMVRGNKSVMAYVDRIRRTLFADIIDSGKQLWEVGLGAATASA